MSKTQKERIQFVVDVFALGLCSYAASRLAIYFLIRPEGMAPFWFANGIVLAVLLHRPRKQWPWLLGSAFCGFTLNMFLSGFPLYPDIFYAIANCVEPLVAALIVQRFELHFTLCSLRELGVLLLAAVIACAIGASIAWLAGPIRWQLWFVDDLLGMILVTPALLVFWARRRGVRNVLLTKRDIVEITAMGIGIIGMTTLIFHRVQNMTTLQYSYITLPFVLWAVLRFHARGAVLAALLLATLTIGFTLNGIGPFAALSPVVIDRSLSVQLFIAIVLLTQLALALALVERTNLLEMHTQQIKILERVAANVPLKDILLHLIHMVEDQSVNLLCSIMLYDSERKILRHGAAPSLPESYNQILDGTKVAVNSGSCGAAAFLGERVVVEDITTHPNWAEYKHLALPHGLRACWSTPIFTPQGEVIGTFAIYYKERRLPTPRELHWVDAATHLAAITILRDRSAETIRKNETHLRQLLETTHEGVWMVDPCGTTTFVNPRLAEMLDSTPAALLGQNALSFRFDEDQELGHAHLQRCLSGHSIQEEMRLKTTAGRTIWVIAVSSPILDEYKQVIGILGMITDISEEKRLAETVRSTEQLRALIYKNVSDPIFYAQVEDDDHFRILSVNAAFLNQSVYTEDQLIGKCFQDLWSGEILENAQKICKTALQHKTTYRWEGEMITLAGRRFVELSITPVVNGDRVYEHIIGMLHDLTERKEAEAHIAEQAALLDHARDAILVRDLDHKISYWNAGAERLYGWPREQILGQSIIELMHRDHRPEYDRAYELVLRNGAWSGEMIQHTCDNQEIVVESSWTLVRDERGLPKSILVIATDVTKRKKLEAQIVLAQRMESLGTLAGGIAHDFNNILTGIIGNISLSRRFLPADHVAQEKLQVAQEASEVAAHLVNQILTFSHHRHPERTVIDMRTVTDEAVHLFMAVHPRTAIRVDFAPDVGKVLADPSQMHQIVMNLLTNAAHALEGTAGGIEIRLETVTLMSRLFGVTAELRAGQYICLTVKDTGKGIDEKIIDRIFDPFFSTKAPGQGTGLGLSVVLGIIRSHGGTVTVQSEMGRGTTFQIYLPVISEMIASPKHFGDEIPAH